MIMNKSDTLYQSYLNILKEELVPAMGCTEPIALAYAAAKAREVLGALPERVEIGASGSIIKNVKSVIVPNTGHLKGMEAAAAAGIIAGDSEKELEVIASVNDEERSRNKVTMTYVSPSNSTGNGRIRYYDINHDGTLSQDDLVYQGNADPYLYGGLQNTFHYKNLRLGIYVNYSLGGKIYNYSEIYMAGSIFTNQYRYMLNAWHPERNPESNIPRAGGKTDAALPSDFMIHDASYIRINNISLSYTLPFKRTFFLRDATFSLIGENLYLWKNYNGFDPDVSSEGTSSTLRRVDLGAYPKSRNITFSIQVRY